MMRSIIVLDWIYNLMVTTYIQSIHDKCISSKWDHVKGLNRLLKRTSGLMFGIKDS